MIRKEADKEYPRKTQSWDIHCSDQDSNRGPPKMRIKSVTATSTREITLTWKMFISASARPVAFRDGCSVLRMSGEMLC
jgi:hypothetical protein